jgi:hypothetical protein
MSVWDTRVVVRPIDRGLAWQVVGSLGFVAVTLVALAVFNDQLVKFYWAPDKWRLMLPFAGAVAGASLFVSVRYADFNDLLSASLRASAAGLLVMLLLERPDYTLANPDTAALAAAYIEHGYVLALACALVGLIRPAFVIPAAIYILSARHLVAAVSTLPMSFLDIRYMVDMALYLAVFGLFVVTLGPRLHGWMGAPARQNEIVGAAFGLHLANYFWSGVAKVVIGPTPWYWIFENKTYNQLPHTIEGGLLPLGGVPWLSQLAYDGLQLGHVPLNAAILIFQLFAIVCVLRANWLKLASVLYDCLHLGIYVFGGLFFWPWIWNNLTILWATGATKGELSLHTKVACLAAIVLGAPALKLNEAAWLAWFDVADARQVYFEAVTKDGRAVKAPSAFFLSHSYSVSHAYMGAYSAPGQYPYTMLASSHSVDRNELSGKCVAPGQLPSTVQEESGDQPETPQQRAERQASLSRFLSAHHQKMLAREAKLGPGSYYLHLHHHPSNPFLYPEFNRLSLHDVVGYRLVLESACHSLEDGRVTKKVWARSSEFFNVS